nr:gamma-glutamyl-gamma-aminobutyrate hydrolase family protein [Microbacterium hydrocarbonoxydans]
MTAEIHAAAAVDAQNAARRASRGRTHVALFHVRTHRRSAETRYQTILDGLNAAAVAAVEQMGWSASLHAAGEESEQQLQRASREADIVVILGGDDVEPALYGQPDRRPRHTDYQHRADRTQIAVVMEAVRSRRPLLGVCRGMQLMNVALGGTLHQHVGGHRGPDAAPFVVSRVAGVASLSAGLRPPLLCIHHQAVDQLGHGFRVALQAADGVVEAITHDSLPFLGVQWHPEHPSTAAQQLPALLRVVHGMGRALSASDERRSMVRSAT